MYPFTQNRTDGGVCVPHGGLERSLRFVHDLQSSDLGSLKEKIEADPTKRLYVKLAGTLGTKQPLKVQSSTGTAHNAVLTLKEIVYLQGISLSAPKPLVSNISTADEVTLELGTPAANPGPKLIIDPKCLEQVQRDHVDTEEKEIGSRMFSAVVSLVGVPWPYRCVTNTMIVPQNRHVFAALDATVDLNGDITLLKPNSFSRGSFLGADVEAAVDDSLTSSSNVWTGLSIGTGVLGIALAAVGFSKKKK